MMEDEFLGPPQQKSGGVRRSSRDSTSSRISTRSQSHEPPEGEVSATAVKKARVESNKDRKAREKREREERKAQQMEQN